MDHLRERSRGFWPSSKKTRALSEITWRSVLSRWFSLLSFRSHDRLRPTAWQSRHTLRSLLSESFTVQTFRYLNVLPFFFFNSLPFHSPRFVSPPSLWSGKRENTPTACPLSPPIVRGYGNSLLAGLVIRLLENMEWRWWRMSWKWYNYSGKTVINEEYM